ncbi:hypothetical protein LSCM1_02199 [Leishmania martiniquensis]|uniref:Uncharacterized protein n=1 Tax=Leishmania martiniquensis TaxID=1580590 RepID=A0A836FS64_9TRYP|nr:hypothetical protein LSCM1_02199 [Leishmania martiniquensis]
MESQEYEVSTASAGGPAASLQAQAIRELFGPRQELPSPLSNTNPHHQSLRTEELNRGISSSLPSSTSASTSAYGSGQADFGTSKGQTAAPQPRQERAEPTLKGCSSHVTPKAPQQCMHSTTPLSPPLPTSTVKAVNCIHTPLRLDSQLLTSPWSGYRWPAAQAPSPTRAVGSSVSVPLASYWNANSSPLPYPSGSPTTHSSGCRILSPSMQSLRQRLTHQQHVNDGASPAQLSFSNLGHDSSLLAASSSSVSAGNVGVVHSAILDAPLQVSLIPPPYRDERPIFSFGNSIMQSAPFTHTLAASASRSHSIYRDTMMELAHFEREVDNPLAPAHLDGTRAPTMGSAILGNNTNPLRSSGATASLGSVTAAGELPNVHLCSTAVPGSSEDAPVGNTDILVGLGTVDWRHLEQPLPANSSLMDQLGGPASHQETESLGSHLNALDNESDDIDFGGEGEVMTKARQRFNGTPEELDSTRRGAQAAATVTTAADLEEPTSQTFGEANVPALLDHTARPNGANGMAGDISLPTNALAYGDSACSMADTVPVTAASREGAGEIATPLLNLPLRSSIRPTTPAGAPAVGATGRVTHDFHLFMPSPIDQGAHVFGAMRDGVARNSPSEQSTSILSLVPAVGVWQASPAIMSAWHSSNLTPTVAVSPAHTLRDLLEMLRLLQSDIDNVYSQVSVSEQVVRRWIRSTLTMLLQLMAELMQSVALAANEAADGGKESAAAAEKASTYAQLRDDISAAAASCNESLRATVVAIKREQENLDPLLLTTMLARGAIGSLLQFLERPSVISMTQSATHTRTPKGISAPSKQCGSGGACGSASPASLPLTPERVEELMDNKALQDDLSSKWPQLASTYNRHVLRYLCLRALYVALSRNDCSEDNLAAERQGCRATTDTDAHAAAPTVLEKVVSAWVNDAALQWAARQPNITHQHRYTLSTTPTLDDDDGAAMREGLCGELPPFECVAEVFSVFSSSESWRWWYSLLNHVMSCNFNVRENKCIFDYVERQLMNSSAAPAMAVRAALASHEVSLEQVEEELEKVELELSAMEESAKAQRVNILQRVLRRIFVLALVSSVQRTLGKDTSVAAAQLATYVQLQRKSLEDVEAQLSAHHAECAIHVKHIRTFLSIFHDAVSGTQPLFPSQPWALGRAAAASGMRTYTNQPHLSLISNSSPDLQSEDALFQWNSPAVVSLAVLLARPRSDNDAVERSESMPMATEGPADSSEEDRTRAAAALARDVATRLVATVQSLCVLLQSGVGVTETHKIYCTSPAKMSAPSTRALRRLQASLSEANHCIRVCMTALRIAD